MLNNNNNNNNNNVSEKLSAVYTHVVSIWFSFYRATVLLWA